MASFGAKIKRRMRSAFNVLAFKFRERKYHSHLKYLLFGGGNELFIIFSGFSSTNIRTYNYVRTLKGVKCDRLYILDVWGYKGSYYLYENGSDTPRAETLSLINAILKKKKYKRVVTMGTSKGGTAAIYYGLEINATEILAGACQYNLGNYLCVPSRMQVFRGMLGNDAALKEKKSLNSVMPAQISKHAGSSSIIHLIYSKKEHTYEDDIVDLLDKLKECHYKVVEKEYDFTNHNDIGIYFKQYLSEYLKLYKR